MLLPDLFDELRKKDPEGTHLLETKDCSWNEEQNKATAVTYDGNNKIVILAYAVVDVENKDNWVWFHERLREDFPFLLM